MGADGCELQLQGPVTKPIDEMIESSSTDELTHALADGCFGMDDIADGLRTAIRLGRVPAIRVLVSAGASVEGIAAQTGWRPLHTAVEHGQVEAIRELAALAADVNSRTRDGMTPLHLAVDAAADAVEQVGTTEAASVVKVLLALGADPGLQDASGRTARDWARDAMSEELLALLR